MEQQNERCGASKNERLMQTEHFYQMYQKDRNNIHDRIKNLYSVFICHA